MGGNMKNDNRGISLVEVMVVVAIMAVLLAVGIMSVNAMSGKPAQQCAQQLMYSLERHRTSAMGKVNSQYVLRVNGSGKIVADEYLTNADSLTGVDPKTVEVGASGNKVTYVCGGATYSLDERPLTLQFDRGSGSFKAQADGTYCTEIIIKRGGREHKVTLVPLTGKVYID